MALDTTLSDPSIYTNYVNGYLTIDKLDDTNYETWKSDIKLWLKNQGYVDHLTQNVSSIDADEASRWLKIEAQSCIILKSTIHSSFNNCFIHMKHV